MEYRYLVFDGRYLTDEDKAMVLEFCYTEKEARAAIGNHGGEEVIVRYRVFAKGKRVELVDPTVLD